MINQTRVPYPHQWKHLVLLSVRPIQGAFVGGNEEKDEEEEEKQEEDVGDER